MAELPDTKNDRPLEPAFWAHCRRLANDLAARRLCRELNIPKGIGKAFPINSGKILRITCAGGPLVADLNVFNLQDPTEKFWSAQTRKTHRIHLTAGDSLWSTPPRMRPMFTIIKDTVQHRIGPDRAGTHDLLFGRCNGRNIELKTGRASQPNCQSNLEAAIAGFNLTPDYVHDPLNVFMKTGMDQDGRLFHVAPDAKSGDYLELLAEMDCLVAISACPGSSSGTTSRALDIAIYEVLI